MSPKVFKSCLGQSRFTSVSRRAKNYLRTNWGAPFVIAFIVLLVASATELSIGAADAANGIAAYGFYSLVAGIVLQISSFVKYGESSRASTGSGAPITAVAPPSRRLSRRTKLVAAASIGLILFAGVIFGYPMWFQPAPVPGEVSSSLSSTQSSSSSSSSGCAGPRSDGTVFISTNATVSVEICGQSFPVKPGAGGGLAYTYHSGIVNFTAPASVNGSHFEFWYVALASGSSMRVSNATLSLNLPAGLTAQNSLIGLFYTAPPSPAQSTTVAANTTTPSVSSTSSTTTPAPTCRGGDGSLFVATNLNATLSIDICGEHVSVAGGVGGGLAFSYSAGTLTFVAPPAIDGKSFEFWYIILPSQQEQIANNQLTISLPIGYTSNNSIIEAFYG
jgi:hypothetical protein